jgi:heme a synthase
VPGIERQAMARWTATGLVAVTYGLLVFGSTVRIHDAGLACPDWPMCYGQVVPAAMDFEIFLEWGHRALAGLVSLAFVGLGGLILTARDLRRRLGALWGVAAVVLAVQIVLGGLTVLELLAEWTVTSHLLAGNTFCLLLLVLSLSLWEMAHPVRRPATGWASRIGVGLLAVSVLAQLGIGGLVAASHAGLACGPEWPNCIGPSWFPTFRGITGLQVIHRIGAYTVLGLAVGMVGLTRLRGRPGKAALVLLGLVLAQATLGVLNVWLLMPALVTALHSAGAALTVLTTTWLVHEVWRAPVARRSVASRPDVPTDVPTAEVA